MAESYFDLLTEQQGLPAKPFDPLGELKCLRRRLSLRLQQLDSPEDVGFTPPLASRSPDHVPKTTPVSLETVVKEVRNMKKTLALWHRSRSRMQSPREGIFRGQRNAGLRNLAVKKSAAPPIAAAFLDVPTGGVLEMLNAGLVALGVIGLVFGVLSFCHGWESGLSLGSLVCTSGGVIVTIGLGGLFFASYSDLSAGSSV